MRSWFRHPLSLRPFAYSYPNEIYGSAEFAITSRWDKGWHAHADFLTVGIRLFNHHWTFGIKDSN